MPRKLSFVTTPSADDANVAAIRASTPEPRQIIKGSGGNDRIDGVNGDDKIYGLGGNDIIFGLNGDDFISGGDGDDYLYGGGGRDVLHGGDGDDRVDGGGKDLLYGEAGNDRFDLTQGDSAIGGSGDDQFIIRHRDIEIKGGSGRDEIVFELKSEKFIAEYIGNSLHLRATDLRGSGPNPQVLVTDKSTEMIAWRDLRIDLRHVPRPTIDRVAAGEEIVPGQFAQEALGLVEGTAAPFARIRIIANDILVGETVADVDGRWSFWKFGKITLQGEVALTVVADYGMGAGQRSKTFDFEINAPQSLRSMTPEQGARFVYGRRSESFVDALGDINGDGYDDAIMGWISNGSVCVIYGGDADLGTIRKQSGRETAYITLYGTDADAGFDLKPPSDTSLPWKAAWSAGDVDGDGIDDLLLGQTRADLGNVAVVMLGGSNLPIMNDDGHDSLDLADVSPAGAFLIHGGDDYSVGNRFGRSAGDMNGDGIGDILIETNEETVFLIYGSSAPPGTAVDGRNVLDLSGISSTEGVRIVGPGAVGAALSIGDVNGDGYGDIAVVADENDAPFHAVIFGKAGGIGSLVGGKRIFDLAAMTMSDGFRISDETEAFGGANTLRTIGDVNGDGFDDVAIAMNDSVAVIYGSDDIADIDIADLSPDEGFTITYAKSGPAMFDVSSAGDFNGDGLDDLVVTYTDKELGGRLAFLLFGNESNPGDVSGDSARLELSHMRDTLGRIFRADSPISTTAPAGDMNGDGFDDLMIVSVVRDRDYTTNYLVYGYDTDASAPVILSGTSAAEILRGGAGDDTLDGNGGADVFRGGAGDDTIRIGDADVLQIRAGRGLNDVLVFDGTGIDLDGRDFGNSQLSGIEAFDLTGSGDNALTLTAADVFQLSPNRNGAFSEALSGNTLVVRGNFGDTLRMIDPLEGNWTLVDSDIGLDGLAGGGFDIYHLVDGADVLASVAVGEDITLLH